MIFDAFNMRTQLSKQAASVRHLSGGESDDGGRSVGGEADDGVAGGGVDGVAAAHVAGNGVGPHGLEGAGDGRGGDVGAAEVVLFGVLEQKHVSKRRRAKRAHVWPVAQHTS